MKARASVKKAGTRTLKSVHVKLPEESLKRPRSPQVTAESVSEAITTKNTG
jgi:hypothetical protein